MCTNTNCLTADPTTRCGCTECHGVGHGGGRGWSPSRYIDAISAISNLVNIPETQTIGHLEKQTVSFESHSDAFRKVSNFVVMPIAKQAVYHTTLALTTVFFPPATPLVVLANYAVSYGPSLYSFSKNIIEWSQTTEGKYGASAVSDAAGLIANKPIDQATNTTMSFLEKQTEGMAPEGAKSILNFVYEQMIAPIASNYASGLIVSFTKEVLLPK